MRATNHESVGVLSYCSAICQLSQKLEERLKAISAYPTMYTYGYNYSLCGAEDGRTIRSISDHEWLTVFKADSSVEYSAAIRPEKQFVIDTHCWVNQAQLLVVAQESRSIKVLNILESESIQIVFESRNLFACAQIESAWPDGRRARYTNKLLAANDKMLFFVNLAHELVSIRLVDWIERVNVFGVGVRDLAINKNGFVVVLEDGTLTNKFGTKVQPVNDNEKWNLVSASQNLICSVGFKQESNEHSVFITDSCLSQTTARCWKIDNTKRAFTRSHIRNQVHNNTAILFLFTMTDLWCLMIDQDHNLHLAVSKTVTESSNFGRIQLIKNTFGALACLITLCLWRLVKAGSIKYR